MRAAVLVTAIGLTPPFAISQGVDGAAVFEKNCQMCHQTGGAGLAGSYPRLTGRIAQIAAKPAGRLYLVDLLTYGMSGTVTVDKQSIMGVMPPFAALTAEDVAAVLTYVQGLGSGQKSMRAFTAQEIAAQREKSPKSSADVFAERRALWDAKVVP